MGTLLPSHQEQVEPTEIWPILWTFLWIICYITLVCQLLPALTHFFGKGEGWHYFWEWLLFEQISQSNYEGETHYLIVQYIVHFKEDFVLFQDSACSFYFCFFFVGVGEQSLFHWWGDCPIIYLIDWRIILKQIAIFLVHWYLVAVLRPLHEIVYWKVVW